VKRLLASYLVSAALLGSVPVAFASAAYSGFVQFNNMVNVEFTIEEPDEGGQVCMKSSTTGFPAVLGSALDGGGTDVYVAEFVPGWTSDCEGAFMKFFLRELLNNTVVTNCFIIFDRFDSSNDHVSCTDVDGAPIQTVVAGQAAGTQESPVTITVVKRCYGAAQDNCP